MRRQALIAVIEPAGFDDPRIRQSRATDHRHVDDVLAARIGDEDAELETLGPRTLLDRLLTPLNRKATVRFLAEARAKVWRNTLVLDHARRDSPDRYAAVLRQLERGSARRGCSTSRDRVRSCSDLLATASASSSNVVAG